MEFENKTCSICNIPIEENYCSRCGQRKLDKPVTIISLIKDFLSNTLSLEKSVFATIFKILINPKLIVDNYSNGYKNYHSSPGKILLYGIAIITLHTSFVDKTVLGLTLNIQNISAQYLFWLLFFPILLFISYVSFIRIEKGLSKHLISLTYIASSLFIVVTILNDIIILTYGDKLGFWAFILFVFFVFLWNSKVLTKRNKFLYFSLNTIIQIIIFAGIISLFILAVNNIDNG